MKLRELCDLMTSMLESEVFGRHKLTVLVMIAEWRITLLHINKNKGIEIHKDIKSNH